MTANREMIDAFVGGRLSAADHELMVHHISSCTECAAAVIAALAEAARALAAEASDRAASWTAGGVQASAAGAHTAEAVPAADLQMDFVLDHAADTPDLLLRRDIVEEIALDSLPLHPQSFREAADAEPLEREVIVDASAEPEALALKPVADEIEVAAEVQVAAEIEVAAEVEVAEAADDASDADKAGDTADEDAAIASVMAAGVAESVAHAAAALAEEHTAEVADRHVDDRVPDEARAAIVRAVRADPAFSASRRRWSGIAAAVAVLIVFAAVGAYAAVQLSAFASPDRTAPAAATVAESELGAVSVLAPVLDSVVYAKVSEFPDSVGAAAQDRAQQVSGTPRTVTARANPSRRDAAARRPTASSRPRNSGARALLPVPSPTSLVPRLLRTTTHQHGNVYLVLREYDASAPAPGSRPGVNEYRWTNDSLTRLFVLSGPVEAAELRAFARKLQPGRTP